MMRFLINYSHTFDIKKHLTYVVNDYAFSVTPWETEIDCHLKINFMCLTIVDDKVLEFEGFCPYGGWILFEGNPPAYKQGVLYLVDECEGGRVYTLTEDWPVYCNKATGWICVGDPNAQGEAVEFMHNEVAILQDGTLRALWLKLEEPIDWF